MTCNCIQDGNQQSVLGIQVDSGSVGLVGAFTALTSKGSIFFSYFPIKPSLKLTANAPENGWLEYDCFLFSRAFAVSFSEYIVCIVVFVQGLNMIPLPNEVAIFSQFTMTRRYPPLATPMVDDCSSWISTRCWDLLVSLKNRNI